MPESNQKLYVPIREATSTDCAYENLLNEAMRKILTWKKQYKSLKALNHIIMAIDQVEMELGM